MMFPETAEPLGLRTNFREGNSKELTPGFSFPGAVASRIRNWQEPVNGNLNEWLES